MYVCVSERDRESTRIHKYYFNRNEYQNLKKHITDFCFSNSDCVTGLGICIGIYNVEVVTDNSAHHSLKPVSLKADFTPGYNNIQ